ncbi:MAG: FMN-binding protein [Butyricicoccus sp.]|nr:FMN-binding protein [Butyricicoccus sp.]
MTKTSNIKEDFIQPVVILALICLVASALLAWVNGITAPIIDEQENAVANAARREVLPEADDFTELDGLPEDGFVTRAYKANNGAGYVFMITCDGFGGKGTMSLICGMDADGKITATQTLAHEETPGMGSKTADQDWRDRFVGKDASGLDSIDTISGATFSSNYYLDGIRSAFEAYEIVK